MEKRIFTVLLLCSFFFSEAQQIVNTCGSHTNANGLQLDWSLGEISILSTKTDYVWTTEGVLQPQAGTTAVLPPSLSNLPVFLGYGLDNSGMSFTNTANNLMLEFTLGEMASKTMTASGNMITQGILQPSVNTLNAPLPVTGLDFFAKRLNKQQVQLDWRTLQEINNNGFYIERRKEADMNFTVLRFVSSQGQNGNSSFPLTYMQLDTNNHAGRTYYRLRQEDLDGRFAYSLIKVVDGDAEQTATLKVWPIPAPKEFNVLFTGIQNDVLMIHDINGRLIRQVQVANGELIKISNLVPGSYLIKLKHQKDLVQKVIVQ